MSTLLFGPGPAEAASRGVPWLAAEYQWAHRRPPEHRVRTPAAGDTVLYRHDAWGEPTEATVDWVQPEDDVDDPHLWEPTLDELGAPVLLEGRAVMAQRMDPWRTVRLRTRYGMVETREARLRGSPGWLPLDWRARRRPVPQPSAASQRAPQLGPVGLPSPPPAQYGAARLSSFGVPLRAGGARPGMTFGPAEVVGAPGPGGPEPWEG